MTPEEAIARLEICVHDVTERFDVRAHPTIWGARWCRGCGSVQVLEHGVPNPKWRAPVLLEIARRELAARAVPARSPEGGEPPPTLR
jgi:hypothetical protein